ncbi:amidohydrolase family protein [Fructobacillus pseudoficulneus]|uniref:Amidohydrolase family protein n=1 Tax=Fructobacillus pseudoficulneus TaxID=220714 RepID=A0A3F3H1Z5_9LACO|nr:amidohydrolase family protein [Fructobacillus pseudoficulneus]GAP02608.1 amidohydrolase family protein [Fructobacillus pseudoficulneus]SEH38532.1 hypothetical protein SAMN05660469_0543 [Fructobacillus pseudoficulneus]
MKKIDGHLHLVQVIAGLNGKGRLNALGNGEAIWDDGTKIKLIPDGWGDSNFTVNSALKVLTENQIDKAVLLQGSLNGYQNYYTYQAVQSYPDRFIGAFAVDPFAKNYLEIVQRHVEELGFRAIKFEISEGGGLHGYHQPPFRLDQDARVTKIFDIISQYPGFTVAIDYGAEEQVSHQPEAVTHLAQRYPDLDFVVCHLSFPNVDRLDYLKATLQQWQPYANIYTDIAAIQDILGETTYPFVKSQQVVTLAKEVLGAKRLIWGTDSPWSATFNCYDHLANWLEESQILTDDELADVLYNNAEKVYFKPTAIEAVRQSRGK